jgi:3',5'-nucleoside bisphosphate phosphatase
MPSRQPFTALCQSLRYNRPPGWFDLHIHTTHSDGLYTAAQVLELARRAGLAGIAITDHDTLAGAEEALQLSGAKSLRGLPRGLEDSSSGLVGVNTSCTTGVNKDEPSPRASLRALGVPADNSPSLEVIPGVEITAEHEGRELHLLGYFIRLDNEDLLAALQRLRSARRTRFAAMVEKLKGIGVAIDPETLPDEGNETLGRRNLANLLVKSNKVGSVREAFTRYLSDSGRIAVAKTRLPVADAIACVHAAGGVAAWAHPPYDALQNSLRDLAAIGLDAVEADYPTRRPAQVKAVRELAANFGLAVSGGSDCHGPDPVRSAVGARGVNRQEIEKLRDRCPC